MMSSITGSNERPRIPVGFIVILACLVLVSACGFDSSEDASPSPTPIASMSSGEIEVTEINLGTGSALVWGSGSYGVVLVHGAIYDAASWTAQAEAIATGGLAVVAVEHATADDTRAAMDYLRRTFGTTAVALVGASAGTGPVLSAATDQSPGSSPVVDLVIILAGSGNVENLKVPSVLFIAAEGDSGAASSAQRMLEATSGDPDDLLIVPGSAHAQALFKQPEGETVLAAIQTRLAERQSILTSEP